jgi:sensor histidine kinase regulating citrate/malate metabolism
LWSPRAGRRGISLAGQFLVLQVTVLLAVLAVSAVVSVRQSDADFRETRGARLRAAAENLAGTSAVRTGLRADPPPASLASYTQRTQTIYNASAVYLARPDGTVVAAADPTARGERIDLGDSTVQQIRSWTGDVDDRGDHALAAQVPVLTARGDLIGIAMVAESYPTLGDRAQGVLPDLVTFLGIGLALGVAGSWLLARLIKRRTRGLEPAEIGALADQREAVLHAIREGVVAVAPDGSVTVMSDSARDLLGLSADGAGRRLDDLGLEPRVRDALAATGDVRDEVLVVSGRVLVLNRNRVSYEGRDVGTVSTLRDRTELLAMQSELSARESITETLRAQTHEFNNQLHTISGLIQLEEYDELSQWIGAVTRRRAEITELVTSRIDDPAVAALLIAKVSLGAERGIAIELAEDTGLPRLDPDLAADVGTVLGNLVDNAVDATVAAGGTTVSVRLREEDDLVLVQVADSGAGVPVEHAAELFRSGYSTKPSDASGRGVGLALVQVVCERRGGAVSVHNERGAVFTARLPHDRGTMREP